MFGFLKKRRRRQLQAMPWPQEWYEVVRRNVWFWRYLAPADQEELAGLVQVFLAEKSFEGCAGLEIDDEIRVTIAAQACLLLLHRETDFYPGLGSILVYPDEYRVEREEWDEDGLVTETEDELAGESWGHGSLVLSWADVKFEGRRAGEGGNIVLHEFAHQLDEESGDSDGAPVLAGPGMYAEWGRVLRREFERLRKDLDANRRTLLDEYAAENPAEFFAVTTETFFCRPTELRARHPELYRQFADFFRQDPAEWGQPGSNKSDQSG